jgi:hypothetical protein
MKQNNSVQIFKDKWWYSTPVIVLLAAFWFFIIPGILAIFLLVKQNKNRNIESKRIKEDLANFYSIQDKKMYLEQLEQQINDKDALISKIKKEIMDDTEKEKERILHEARIEAEKANETLLDEVAEKENNLFKKETELNEKEQKTNEELYSITKKIEEHQNTYQELSAQIESLTKEISKYERNSRKFRSDLLGMKNFSERFPFAIDEDKLESAIKGMLAEIDRNELLKTVSELHLHSDNSKELRKLSNATKKEIKSLLESYASRYTTKANKTIYTLLVIALQAETQIIIYNLRYEKLQESKDAVKQIVNKYLIICGEGNKSILSTLTKFLMEIEPLYLELVEIEYKYYTKKEKEKEEQRLIKEQMRQEAAERKALQEEEKKLKQEEEKFKAEMIRNKELLEAETDTEKIKQLLSRISELEIQMNSIEEKKEAIATLANGKAGYVYVISNKGSFGDTVFKIGMTRRMDPQERINELGDASVPFKFDVHAMIFSDDAVGLENTLHERLNDKRVNKVNYRKEFFRSTIDELEVLVEEIDPTAEFIKTMLAEEYNQTLAIEEEQQNVVSF